MQNDCFTEAALNVNAEVKNAPVQTEVQVANPETTAQQVVAEVPQKEDKKNTAYANRMHDYREHLKTISNGLMEMAKAAGREDKLSCNQLLRECYNLVGATLDTFDGWKEKGYSILKGQHAFLFWGEPITNEEGQRYCPVKFMFSLDQVKLNAA